MKKVSVSPKSLWVTGPNVAYALSLLGPGSYIFCRAGEGDTAMFLVIAAAETGIETRNDEAIRRRAAFRVVE